MSQKQLLALHQQITLKVNHWIAKKGDEVLFFRPKRKDAGQPIQTQSKVDSLPNPFSNPRVDDGVMYDPGREIIAVIMGLSDPFLAGLDQSGNIVQDETKEEHEPRVMFAREFIPKNSAIQRSFIERNAETGIYEPQTERLLCVRGEPYGEKPHIQIAYFMIPFFNEIIIE